MMASHRPRHSTGARAQAGDSSSVIYDAAKDSDWQRVLELCETNPDCASYQGPDGCTALHLACSQKCPDTAVFETLLQTSPDSILKQENKGMVPLHYACRFQASADIVRVMVNLFPEFGVASVSKRDRKRRPPLYYAEKEGAPSDVVSMLREIYPNGSEVRMDDDELEVPPSPRPEPVNRVSSFYLSLLGGDPGEPMAPDENGFGNHEILEQFKIMAEHEALRRMKQATGKNFEGNHERNNKGGESRGVILVKKNKMLLRTRLPEPKRITCAGTFAELQEPSLPSFRPTPTFCGRTKQMEPEVTSGERVFRDAQVPMHQRIIQCLGCREKLSCKQKAMMVHCPNCSVESPAILTSQEIEV